MFISGVLCLLHLYVFSYFTVLLHGKTLLDTLYYTLCTLIRYLFQGLISCFSFRYSPHFSIPFGTGNTGGGSRRVLERVRECGVIWGGRRGRGWRLGNAVSGIRYDTNTPHSYYLYHLSELIHEKYNITMWMRYMYNIIINNLFNVVRTHYWTFIYKASGGKLQ